VVASEVPAVEGDPWAEGSRPRVVEDSRRAVEAARVRRRWVVEAYPMATGGGGWWRRIERWRVAARGRAAPMATVYGCKSDGSRH
jgi:hypothetical protein